MGLKATLMMVSRLRKIFRGYTSRNAHGIEQDAGIVAE